MIPRRLFQVWIHPGGVAALPEHWVRAMDTVIRANPGFEHTLVTDAPAQRVITDNVPDFLPRYLEFEHDVQRADAIRCVLMHVFGGVYLDLDFEGLRSLEPFLASLDASGSAVGLIPSNNTPSAITNSFFASRPGFPLWLACVEWMKRPAPFWAVTRHLEVFTTTGPWMLRRALADLSPHERASVSVRSDVVLPCTICDINRGSCAYHEDRDRYLRPVKGQLWNGTDTRVINFVFCNWLAMTVTAALIAILANGLARRRIGKT